MRYRLSGPTGLRAALADLRELAQGIFPVILAEEGLSAAVEALAEAVPVPLEITTLPAERLGSSVEAAAYFVVPEAVRRAAAGTLKVCAARRGGLARCVLSDIPDGRLGRRR